MTDDERWAWRKLEQLEQGLSTRGGLLELNDETLALLRAGAQLVDIDAARTRSAVCEASAATALLREMGQRLRAGSARLGGLESRVEELRGHAEFAQARKELEGALSLEVVPHYREQLEIRLDYLATFESIFQTGQVEADFHPWGQVRALALRSRRGLPPRMSEPLRDLLHRVASTLAIQETEVEEALRTEHAVEHLIQTMADRMEEGRRRIAHVLQQVIRFQEAGDIESARGQLQAPLVVEDVPLYRRMAEENLAGLDVQPPKGHD